MSRAFSGIVLAALLIGACHTADSINPASPTPAMSVGAGAEVGGPTAGGATTIGSTTASGDRPWKASLTWWATNVQWAGQPGTATSFFDGRCSVASDYVIEMSFTGTATHGGRITGTNSHCSQVTWTPQGPGGVTYGDGRGEIRAADGSTLLVTYGNGVTGVDTATGELWYQDTFTFDGGAGRFAEASGGGTEGGRITDFGAVLVGAPAQMWMEGTISLSKAGGRNR